MFSHRQRNMKRGFIWFHRKKKQKLDEKVSDIEGTLNQHLTTPQSEQFDYSRLEKASCKERNSSWKAHSVWTLSFASDDLSQNVSCAYQQAQKIQKQI